MSLIVGDGARRSAGEMLKASGRAAAILVAVWMFAKGILWCAAAALTGWRP